MLNVNFSWLNAGIYTEPFIYAPARSVKKRKALLIPGFSCPNRDF